VPPRNRSIGLGECLAQRVWVTREKSLEITLAHPYAYQELQKVRSMSQNRLVAVFCVALALPAYASAMDSTQLISALERLNDGNGAQKIAIELAELVERGDKIALATLGKQIEAEDGLLLSEIAGLNPNGGNEKSTTMALSIRPCQYANLIIRVIALKISNGQAQPIIRRGTVMIDGTELDSDFAKHMWRCEVLNRLPHKTSIGSKCAMTGDCKDDPDL
jgi:hypothetical protein